MASFYQGNIHKFFSSIVPFDTVFKLMILGKSKDNTMMIIPKLLAVRNPLEIHVYSVTDNRSA